MSGNGLAGVSFDVVEIGGGERHVLVCDRGCVINAVLWDGVSDWKPGTHRREDGTVSELRVVRHDTAQVGDVIAP
jgi:hypothetical protein